MTLKWQHKRCQNGFGFGPNDFVTYTGMGVIDNNGADPTSSCVKKQYRTTLNYNVTMDVCAIRCVAELMTSTLTNEAFIVSHANHTIIPVGEIFYLFIFHFFSPYVAFLGPLIIYHTVFYSHY